MSEQHGPEKDALGERLRRAATWFEEFRDHPANGPLERARLNGKIEGVKLAASYLVEGERIADSRPWRRGDGDSRCQSCGHAYAPWFTDNALWNRVTGGPGANDDPGGCLCPRCFIQRAEDVFPFVWRLVPEWTGALTRVLPPTDGEVTP